jgi:uncharacterized small protein (DUF1192 family)
MNTLPLVKPEVANQLRDAQREADQAIVNGLNERIARLESEIEELKADNARLEAWVKSEKRTYKLQHSRPEYY